MLLPDPRKEVIVRRVLNDRTVALWYPGNAEALQYNQKLRTALGDSPNEFLEEMNSTLTKSRGVSKQTLYSSAIAGYMDDEMERKLEYTKPRTIKLDTKYDGAVLLNIWPNFAVQVVNKTGDRRVVEGPKVIMLEYDETLEVLELSTGKPKSDNTLMKTVYLQTKNNVVSDIVTVETKDLISVDVRISYKVDFESDAKKWFNVSDYVKLLAQHMRSLIRNVVKKQTIEFFNENAADIIRDTILGESKEGKRLGRAFSENGMKIYDVEVLNVGIDDEDISDMLIRNQHDIVEQNLELVKLEKDLEYSKKSEEINRLKLEEQIKTLQMNTEVALLQEDNANKLASVKLTNQKKLKNTEVDAEKELQKSFDIIAKAKLGREKELEDTKLLFEKERSTLHIAEVQAEMAAITPGLIEALISSNDVNLAEILAKNIKEQKGGGLSDLFGKSGGFEGLLATVAGTPLYDRLSKIHEDYKKMKTP